MAAKLKRLGCDDHEYDLSDSFSDEEKRITQTRYYRAGDVVIAVGELNYPNQWDDEAFDKACGHLERTWGAK